MNKEVGGKMRKVANGEPVREQEEIKELIRKMAIEMLVRDAMFMKIPAREAREKAEEWISSTDNSYPSIQTWRVYESSALDALIALEALGYRVVKG